MTTIINLFISLILKVVLSWNTSASLTHCVHVLSEWLWIMLLLKNISLGFSLMNFLYAHVVIILLRWGCTFYMGVYNIGSLSGMVHTGVEVCRMDLEMSGLVKRPWLQLMCCAICLPRGCNFRWKEESPSGSEYWLVCRCWTPEIEFNKRLSSSIIRLANYSVTTSLIYKLIV